MHHDKATAYFIDAVQATSLYKHTFVYFDLFEFVKRSSCWGHLVKPQILMFLTLQI